MTGRLFRRLVISLALAALVLAGCGPEQGKPHRNEAGKGGTAKSEATQDTVKKGSVAQKNRVAGYTPPKKLLPAPEPAASPPLREKPAGRVVKIGSGPEGIVADPKTGLVAVGLRDPDELALVDGGSGKVVRKVKLFGAARHLGLAAPGGPVLVPAETSDSLVQVGLPDGKILKETPVDNFPHNVSAAPGGRIFVISEAESTVSVIERGKVAKKIKSPLNPGGVAVTRDGLLGVVGVRGLALGVYGADTLRPLGLVNAGKGPTHVEAGPNNRFYVADTRGDAVLVYETSPGLKQVARVPLQGGSPYGVAVDPRGDRLWVTLTAENRLIEFTLGGGVPREIASYPTVRQPNSVAVNPTTGRVFVAGRAQGVLQMLDP